MPTYRRKNNPVTTIKLTPEELAEKLRRDRDDEVKKGWGPDHHTMTYSIPFNNKHRAYR